jgi:hypothetical protein
MDSHDEEPNSLIDHEGFYRSRIIDAATVVDELLSRCIAWYFCQDEAKHLSFIALIFNRAEVTFSKKIEIFGFIFRSQYADLCQELPQLINKLESLRKLRNKFAHTELMSSSQKQRAGSGIHLRYINRDGKQVEEAFTEIELREKISSAYELTWNLSYLVFEFRHRAMGGKPHKFIELWDVIEGGSELKE